MEDLRKRRAKLLEAQEQKRLRDSFGQNYSEIVATSTGKALTLEDFDPLQAPGMDFEWPKDLAAAPGLVAAYIDKQKAHSLLACFRGSLGRLDGRIGFHDNTYLGLAAISELDVTQLLAVSERSEDSVLFYCDDPKGVILVDCYVSQPAPPFSVVVQGDAMIKLLESCYSP